MSLFDECKFFDTSRIGVNPSVQTDASGGEMDPTTLNCLSCPSQGDGSSDRDGRQIVMARLQINGTIKLAAESGQSAADTIGNIFVAIVWDKQTNGSQLSSEDVYTNPAGNIVTAPHPFLNLENEHRFCILKSKMFAMHDPNISEKSGTNIEQSGYERPFYMDLDLPQIIVNFKGNAGSVADVVDNSLHVISFMSVNNTSITLNYNARLRFYG